MLHGRIKKNAYYVVEKLLSNTKSQLNRVAVNLYQQAVCSWLYKMKAINFRNWFSKGQITKPDPKRLVFT